MEVPGKQRYLHLLVVLIISAAWSVTPAVVHGESENKQEDLPLVYDQQQKHHSTTSTPSVDTDPPSPEMFGAQPATRRAAAASSSVIFPVQGNVHPDGFYYASVYIGEPPKLYFLEIDTGSELTWIYCDGPRVSPVTGPHPLYRFKESNLVFRKDPLCVSLKSSPSSESDSADQKCKYKIRYVDGSSRGVMVKDTFNLGLINGSVVRSRLAFGCGYNHRGSLATFPSPSDGMLGLLDSKLSIVSQLQDQGLIRNVIGHCMNGQNGGYLFFGDDGIPSSGMTWISMAQNPSHKYYSPGPANLSLGRQLLIEDLVVIFDSGTSFTYFASQPFQAFVSKVKKNILEKPLSETTDHTLPLCWKGKKQFKTILDVNKYFEPLILDFKNSKNARLQISPEGYLIISETGNVCLGILNGTEAGLKEQNILGAISLQRHVIVYDNEKSQIGWTPADCSRIPGTDVDDGNQEDYTRPYADNMGILKEEPLDCPADNLPQQTDMDECEVQTSKQSESCTYSGVLSHINKCGIL